MSPLLMVFVGGILGGIVSGVVIGVVLALFGRRIADGVLRQQVSYLETRLKETILDVGLGRIASFLDQSERIGQIVKRLVEILQLVFRGATPEVPVTVLPSKPVPVPAPASAA